MVDDGVRQIDRNLSKALGKRVANRGFGNEAEGYQRFAERCLALALLNQRDIELILRNYPARKQTLSER